YCTERGKDLRRAHLGQNRFDKTDKKEELRSLLKLNDPSTLVRAHRYSSEEGWERMALETSDNKLIPLLHFAPEGGAQNYTVVSHMDGKNGVSSAVLGELKEKGSGIIIVGLSGTGEAASAEDLTLTRLSRF